MLDEGRMLINFEINLVLVHGCLLLNWFDGCVILISNFAFDSFSNFFLQDD